MKVERLAHLVKFSISAYFNVFLETFKMFFFWGGGGGGGGRITKTNNYLGLNNY